MKWVIAAVLLSASIASAQGIPFPGPGRAPWGASGPPPAGGTDFTADPDFLGCWAMASADSQAAFELDNCTADASADNMTWNNQFGSVPSAPAGSVFTRAAYSDGGITNGYMSLADDNRFEVADFTIGCWYTQDGPAPGSDYVFSKDDLTAWELQAQASGTAKFEVQDEPELTATSIGADEWQHRVMRYDGSGTSADAVDNAVEVFTNGLIDCAGGCKDQPISPAGNAGNITILAQSSGGASKLDGSAHSCFYAARVLSDAEIEEIFLCGLTGGDDGTAKDAAYSGAICDTEGCCP